MPIIFFLSSVIFHKYAYCFFTGWIDKFWWIFIFGFFRHLKIASKNSYLNDGPLAQSSPLVWLFCFFKQAGFNQGLINMSTKHQGEAAAPNYNSSHQTKKTLFLILLVFFFRLIVSTFNVCHLVYVVYHGLKKNGGSLVLNVLYSVMQSDGNSFCGDVVFTALT